MPYKPKRTKFDKDARPPVQTYIKPFMTKEEFMIDWVLKRAAFREEFSGTLAAKTASEVWDKIQELKGA